MLAGICCRIGIIAGVLHDQQLIQYHCCALTCYVVLFDVLQAVRLALQSVATNYSTCLLTLPGLSGYDWCLVATPLLTVSHATACVCAAGGATGFAIGGYRYLNLPADPAFSTAKLKANRLINTSGATSSGCCVVRCCLTVCIALFRVHRQSSQVPSASALFCKCLVQQDNALQLRWTVCVALFYVP
jgi:hypothetical protein